MKNIKVETIVCHATAGAEVGNCVMDAIALAANEQKNVEFTHNGLMHRIVYKDLLGCVRKERD